jgi:hypothetical protein
MHNDKLHTSYNDVTQISLFKIESDSRDFILKSKAISVTGLGGLWGCKMLRIAQCLDNRPTYVVKLVRSTCRPRSTSQKPFLFLFLLLISTRAE